MEIIKRFVLIEYEEETINDDVLLTMTLGRVGGPYYSRSSPDSIFDTEDEAIAEAYQRSRYKRYIILPIVSFDNF